MQKYEKVNKNNQPKRLNEWFSLYPSLLFIIYPWAGVENISFSFVNFK